ncbi:MAG TPA: glycerol-3-phosphate 1-O-acyltransferase PlsY [Vicinamibacterales bacterium]|jgi:glycerol-3-phosphate acyltransferase PlsY|nr:glycerol-3-phosphate 1-O-acyltransferase PlsY [Vicinamibacterales bacterium]
MIAWALFGYLLGSVPFAFLLARRAGIDVRFAGSGNVGAANVLRTSGTPLGVAVMALDISKGTAAVLTAYAAGAGLTAMALAGAAAIVGHIYPVWLRFKGGKGVAVAAGVFVVLAPLATSIAALVFVACVWISRIVSIGSIAATITLPSIAWWTGAPGVVVNTSAGCASLIVFRHRANIRRILMGTERRLRGRVA